MNFHPRTNFIHKNISIQIKKTPTPLKLAEKVIFNVTGPRATETRAVEISASKK